MLDDVIAKDGTLDSLLLDELYYETLDLTELVVDYLHANRKMSFQHLGVEAASFYTLECNRLTAGIMQAMSWCLMQKGVRSGEVKVEEAAEKASRLSSEDLFDAPVDCDTAGFPESFLDYSTRVRELYRRIVRLDRLLYEDQTGGKNPVHSLMEKLEDS